MRTVLPMTMTLAIAPASLAACTPRAGDAPGGAVDASPRPAGDVDASLSTPREETHKAGDARDQARASPTDPGAGDDLARLCKSVHDDYGDGTLSDYGRGVHPTSAWGRALVERASESMTPGRVIEAAVTSEKVAPVPAPCQSLFDDLDDLE